MTNQKLAWPQMAVLLASLATFGLSLNKSIITVLDVDELFEIQQFIRPPLLNLFTNYWVNGQLPYVILAKFFGLIAWDVFTLRFSSIAVGVLCIPLMYRLGCSFFNGQVAALSALLLSVTITHIRYAAYIRGYSLLVLLSLITIYCFSQAIQGGKRAWWLGFGLAAAVNIHNHIFTVFLLAVLYIYIVAAAWLTRRKLIQGDKHQLQNVAVASLLIFLLLLPMPILFLTGRNNNSNLSTLLINNWLTSFPPFSLSQPFAFLEPLAQMSYTFSPTRYPGWQTYLFITFFVIGAGIGLKNRNRRQQTLLLLLILFLAPLLMSLATTVLGPRFYALRRYFLFVMPPYLLLAAVGIIVLSRLLSRFLLKAGRSPVRGGVMLLILTLPIITPIAPYTVNNNAVYPARPYVIGRYLQARVQPQDIVICVPDEDWRVTIRGSVCSYILNVYAQTANNVYNLDDFGVYQTLQKFLEANGACANRYVHMPRPYYQLECHPQAEINNSANLWLVLWRSRDVTVKASLAQPPGPLTQQRFEATDIIYLENKHGLADLLTQAGEIALQESKTPLRKLENYISLANIYAATGNISQALSTLDEAIFVSRWPEAQTQLTALQAKLSFLPASFEPKVAMDIVWNDEIILRGLDQNLALKLIPDDVIQITFYWQILQPVSTNYQFLVHLLNKQGTPVATFDYQPFNGQRPLTDWTPGQTIRETRLLTLPPNLPPGRYKLVVGVYHPNTLKRLPITHGSAVDVWPLAEWEFN